MEIIIEKNSILLAPKTDFESQVLENFAHNKKLSVFLKHGSSADHVVGLKIISVEQIKLQV